MNFLISTSNITFLWRKQETKSKILRDMTFQLIEEFVKR